MDTRQPNVLLVLTDQERYDCTASEGAPVNTPNLDRIHEEGMHFEHAFTPISICTSARASLLTGLYPHGHGLLNNSHEADAIRSNLPSKLPTFSEGLSEAGYGLSYTGKWHVGRDQTPEDFGFSYLGGSDRHHDDIDEEFPRFREELGVDVTEADLEDRLYTDDGLLVAGTTPAPAEATRAALLANLTIEALESALERDGPFFHRADFLGPHHPYVIPEEYDERYDPDAIEPWDSFAETFAGKPAAHEQFLDYRGVGSFEWETWAELVAKYWGFLDLIDDQVGRILSAMEELGILEETVIVHASDHGDFLGTHRQFNKGPLMYDDTYRIPLAVRWPAVVEPGSTSDAMVHLHDLAPTFLEIGEATVPEDLHGRSLLPVLQDRTPPEWPESVFAQYHGEEFGLYSQRMVRTDRHKFVYNGPDRNELYDFGADPEELQNLIDHPEYARVRRDMARRLTQWMQETDDPLAQWVPDTFDRDAG